MNATPLVIAAFVLMVLGVPAIVGAIRARWIEQSIFFHRMERRADEAVAEFDLEQWDRDMDGPR